MTNIYAFSRNKNKDFEKLSQAFFANIERKDDGEYGSIGTDCKRPFGNSDVEGDILDIIGADKLGDDGEDISQQHIHVALDSSIHNHLPLWIQNKYLIDKEIKDRFDYQLKRTQNG